MIDTSWDQAASQWRLQILDEAGVCLSRSRAPAAARDVLLALLRSRLKLSSAPKTPTVTALAAGLDIHPKTVQRSLAWLQHSGMLCVGRGPGGRILKMWIPFAFIHNLIHSLPAKAATRTKMSGSPPPRTPLTARLRSVRSYSDRTPLAGDSTTTTANNDARRRAANGWRREGWRSRHFVRAGDLLASALRAIGRDPPPAH